MAKSIPLRKFKGFKAEIKMDETIMKSATDMVKDLKKTSPNGNRKKNKYKKTWSAKFYPKEHMALVYNGKTNYRLTHLLENGHVIVNRKDGIVGWARPQKHIFPAFVRADASFTKMMAKVPLELLEK